MPYMYCNHSECNETVQVHNKNCYKHTPKKAAVKLDEFVSTQVEDVKSLNTNSNKPKKTTII